MSLGLAIETSGRIGSVALVDKSQVLAAAEFSHGLKHAAEMIPAIDRLLRETSHSPREIQELFLSIGPGSFTGLRIGVTLAKTLAFATGVKLVAVPTLAVLAENAPAEAQDLIVVLDAKRDQIFTARFQRQNGAWIEIEPAHLDGLKSMLARAPRPVHLLGEGLPYHEKFLVGVADVTVTDGKSWRARAEVVAEIGRRFADRGEFADPMRLTPLYVRKPEAEEKYEKSH